MSSHRPLVLWQLFPKDGAFAQAKDGVPLTYVLPGRSALAGVLVDPRRTGQLEHGRRFGARVPVPSHAAYIVYTLRADDSVLHQVCPDVVVDDLADDVVGAEGAGAVTHDLVQAAFEGHRALQHARRLHPRRGRRRKGRLFPLIDTVGILRRRDIHGLAHGIGDDVDDILAGRLDVAQRVLGLAVAVR